MFAQGAASSGTVAMNYGAVDNAGGTLVKYSGAINVAMSDLNTALGPVRESWYASGSQSGMDAQQAETKLRQLLNEMNQIIHNLGGLLSQSAQDGAALDTHLAGKFQQHGSTPASSGLY
jgi:uncharacterized protein YukE